MDARYGYVKVDTKKGPAVFKCFDMVDVMPNLHERSGTWIGRRDGKCTIQSTMNGATVLSLIDDAFEAVEDYNTKQDALETKASVVKPAKGKPAKGKPEEKEAAKKV